MTEFDPQKRGASALQRWLGRVFPERQLMIRTQGEFRAIALTSRRQLGFSLVLLTLFGWLTYSTVVVVWLDEILNAKDDSIAETRNEYKGILAELGVYRSVVSAIRETVDKPVASGEGALVAMPARGGEAGASTAGGVQSVEQRELLTQLAYIEQGISELSQARDLLTDLEKQQVEVRQVLMERDLVKSENRELQGRIIALEGQVRAVEVGQLKLVERFADLTQTKISSLERSLTGTGVDIKGLLKRQTEESARAFGQGGPFVPLDLTDIDHPAYGDATNRLQDNVDQWAMMKGLAERLPLADPLKGPYRLTSPFGGRSDPINGLTARHEGVDMGASRGTPIFVTAPGKVVYAGWRGRYGRVVDVDHGMGLITRYAHMDTVSVQMGQRLVRNDKIGTVGNTGRSTGPHLHYEVRVNGRPNNPQTFIKAGKDVFEGQQ